LVEIKKSYYKTRKRCQYKKEKNGTTRQELSKTFGKKSELRPWKSSRSEV
jgi:hypothetical protein